MAGQGPPPKPADQRRRRNAPSFEWVVLPREGRERRPPTLPRREWENERETKRWWRQIWRSPMATQWDEVGDLPALIELAILRDLFMAGRVTLGAEVRLRSDEFGLTPKGRQSLRWIVEGEAREEVEVPSDELEAKRARRERIMSDA